MNPEIFNFLKQYLVTFLVFLAIDGVWLTVVAKNFYSKHLGYLMSPSPNLGAALLFYLLNIIGMLVLVILPNLKDGNLGRLALMAALYGLCTYATYDLTNQATIKDWPVIVTIVDLIWGTALTTAVSVISFLILKRLG